MTTEKRLEKLERELSRANRLNRWLLAGVGLCLGIGLVAWAFGPTVATAQPAGAALKVVRANQFVLEDETGKTRARLRMSRSGPELVLCDEKGNPRAELSVDKDRPRLALLDEDGKGRAVLSVSKGGASVSLSDEKGKTRASLVVLKGGPSVNLDDEKGNTRVSLVVLKGGPSVTLADEKGKTRAELGVGVVKAPGGTKAHFKESSLRLFGPDGKLLWKAP